MRYEELFTSERMALPPALTWEVVAVKHCTWRNSQHGYIHSDLVIGKNGSNLQYPLAAKPHSPMAPAQCH